MYDELRQDCIQSKTESDEVSDSRKPNLQAFDTKMASLPNEMSILYEKNDNESLFRT